MMSDGSDIWVNGYIKLLYIGWYCLQLMLTYNPDPSLPMITLCCAAMSALCCVLNSLILALV